MNKKLLCITFLLLIYSCVNDEPDDSLTEITIDQAELILSAEKDDEIARPSTFRVTTDGFCLYDFGLHKILCYDENGNRQLMFGKEGQGPGEFQGLAGFWIFDELITAFDQQGAKLLYYDHDGSFLREENLEQENFAPGLTMIGPEQLFIPLNGKDGKLAAYFDNKSGERFSFGGADLEESEFDASEISQSIERGTLPDFMLGRVMIAAGENHVYLFHIATGKIQAFDNSGTLLAETTLNLPVMESIKEEFFEQSSNALEQGFFIIFSYISSMVATEDGVALLFNGPSEHPATVLHLNNTLETKTAFYYNSEELGRVSTFDIDVGKNRIYFVNSGTSEVFSASWMELGYK